MIRVIIADDQDILKEGLKMILGKEEDLEIIGLASDGREVYDLVLKTRPDIILMDIKMPNINGVDATKKIKEQLPNIKIIVLTTFIDDEYIYKALKYGASGYLLKDTSPEKIAEAIRTVYFGGALIQPDVAVKVIDRFSEMANNKSNIKVDVRVNLLTIREKDISSLLGEGKNNKEIAQALYLSEGTVKNHITTILSKLELRDRTQLAIFAVKNGLCK